MEGPSSSSAPLTKRSCVKTKLKQNDEDTEFDSFNDEDDLQEDDHEVQVENKEEAGTSTFNSTSMET